MEGHSPIEKEKHQAVVHLSQLGEVLIGLGDSLQTTAELLSAAGGQLTSTVKRYDMQDVVIVID